MNYSMTGAEVILRAVLIFPTVPYRTTGTGSTPSRASARVDSGSLDHAMNEKFRIERMISPRGTSPTAICKISAGLGWNSQSESTSVETPFRKFQFALGGLLVRSSECDVWPLDCSPKGV